MNTIFTNRIISAIALIIIGIIGQILSPLVLFIAAILIIVYGIYNISQKVFDAGIIITLIGVGILFISRFLNQIIKWICSGCIIVGIILLIYFLLTKDKE